MLTAVYNSVLILTTVFYTVEDFWTAACLVYAIVIVVANLRVAQKLNNHTWISTSFLIGSTVCFFA